jgi:hypothetical protein
MWNSYSGTNYKARKDPLLRNDWQTIHDIIKQGGVTAVQPVNSSRCQAVSDVAETEYLGV